MQIVIKKLSKRNTTPLRNLLRPDEVGAVDALLRRVPLIAAHSAELSVGEAAEVSEGRRALSRLFYTEAP